MAIAPPSGPLWAAVTAVYDPWPADAEEVAAGVGAAWRNGDGVVEQGVLDAGQAGTDLASLWGGDSGPAFRATLANYAQATDPVRERMRTLEAMGRHYADELASAKRAIVDTIGRNEAFYAFWGNPMLGELGPAIQNVVANQVANDLRAMIAEKAAALRANPTGAPPPPPPPEDGGWDLGTLAHGALDVLGLIPGVGELADGVNAAWYAAEGDYVNAGLSAAATIPGAGAAVIAAKYGKKLADAATAARGVDARVGAVDPIDVATGEMFLHQVDLELPGVLPLVLTRTHLSSYRAGASFGPTWSSTVDQRLELAEEGVAFFADQGVLLCYPPVPTDAPVLPAFGPRWPLRRAGAGYVIEKPDEGVHLEFAPPHRETARLAAIVDRNGNRVDVVRDARGTPREVRHSGGYHVVLESEDGLVTGMRLRTTATSIPLASYRYDGASRLVEVVNSSGRPLRFEYDPVGRIVRWEDRNAHWYTYLYDDQGRCVRTDGAGGFLTGQLAYTRRRTVVTDALGGRTTYDLNEQGQVIRETDPLGNVTLSAWDRYDRLLSRTDPLGRTMSSTYDEDGNLVAVVRPDGGSASATYNTLRLPVTVTDPDGTVCRHEYDQRGNLTSSTDPTGARTQYRYTADGRLTSVANPLGHTRYVETNAAGLPLAVTDALGARTRFDRDVFGRVVQITDPVGGVTRLRWTVEGKLLSRSLPDGATEHWRYDGEGNPTEHIDALGQSTHIEYTAFDQPAAHTNPDGARYEFGYDTALRLVSVTNPHGLVWRYDYDPAGRLTSETDFNGRTIAYTRDSAGQLVERVNGAGERVRFVRDTLGQVIEKHVGDVLATFGYDAMGRLVRATNPDADVTFQRDALGRVLAESVNGHTVTSAYDPAGRRVRLTTPSGAESTWEYDAAGQAVALHTAGHTMRFDHDPAGREVRRTLGTGVTLAQAWDTNHRLASQVLTATNQRLIQRRGYEYRLDGYVVGIHDQFTGARRFELDSVGRVTAVRGNSWTERYAYDSAGNMTAADWPQSAGEGHGGREYVGTLITRAGRTHYQHDAQGRMVLRRRHTLSGQTRDWRYTWDADDRLTGVTTPDGVRWVYRYDPLGRRIAKQGLATDSGEIVEQVDFTWDGAVLVEQNRSLGPNPSRNHVTSWNWQQGSFRPLIQTERTPLRDAPQESVDEQFYALVTDLVGTPTEMVDHLGGLAWRGQATVWGNAIAGVDGGPACPLRFPGQYFDEETGQHYNYFRYYDPDSGRYQSNDPLGLTPAPSPHAYVHNPLSWLDPFGLAPMCPGTTLYHYTSPAGEEGIRASGRINASHGDIHARHGDGHYFTDIPPEAIGARRQADLPPGSDQMSLGQLARRLFGQPLAGRKLDNFLEIDVSGLDIVEKKPNIFLHSGTDALDVADRIVRSGPTL